jgi:hypothetical protein
MTLFTRSRAVSVAVAVGALMLCATTGAVAGSLITSADIKDHTIQSVDLHSGAVDSRVVANGTLRSSDLTRSLKQKVNRPPLTLVRGLHGAWRARATDTAGVTMTGDGVQFGPFADAGQCSTPGQDFGRLDFSGMNCKPLSALRNLVIDARYTADNDTGGVGSPYVRVFFSGTGTGGDGIPDEPNRLTFSPNTQWNNPNDYDFAQGAMHEWVITSGTVRYNDDGDYAPAGEKAWSAWVSQFPGATITNINVALGCSSGLNLTGLLRSAEVNGHTYQFGG